MAPLNKQWNYEKDEDLVLSQLIGLTRSNANLRLISEEKVVFNANSKEDKVMLLSGGGSGHEPLHCGFVGNGLLDIGVAGHVFASPSTKQILAGIKSKNSKAGTLIIVKNYTGDILHFGLAAERAKAKGYNNVELVIVSDDVSVGKTKNGLVGRRGLAGTALVHKILGAKSVNGGHLKELAKLGNSVVKNLVTIGASLDHCSIPGRSDDGEQVEFLRGDEMEIGMGIHNEPGVKKVSPIPTINQLIKNLLEYLLSEKDEERHYVHFDPKDEVVLLVNNLGGVSNLELYAITHHVFDQLAKDYNIKPIRVYTGAFTTSLNGQGFSITLLNATNVADDDVIGLLDAPTDAIAWNSNFSGWRSPDDEIFVEHKEIEEEKVTSNVKVDSKRFVSILKSGLNAVLAKEPEITKYDTIAGDGDCGETLSNGANAIIESIDSGKLETTDLVRALIEITDLVEDSMGGTSGGLYSIFLSSFAQALRTSDSHDLPSSLKEALKSLYKYTRARVGDRTLVDALDPFVTTFYETKGDFAKAVEAGKKGAESTRTLEAKFGRASYVDQDELKKEGGLPDPGAIGLAALFDGFYNAYK